MKSANNYHLIYCFTFCCIQIDGGSTFFRAIKVLFAHLIGPRMFWLIPSISGYLSKQDIDNGIS